MVHIFFDDKGKVMKKKASPKLKKKASPKLKKKASPKPKKKVSQDAINKYINDYLFLYPENQGRKCSPRSTKKSKTFTKKELVAMAKAIGIPYANVYSKEKLCDMMKLDIMAL